ncbi:MAG: glycosyltransferase [Planctomycetes bacterium]|nr:glycosyltransferase [Planctomycetota bacterium]
MKILHVNDYRDAGGCEVVMQLTVSLLNSHGMDVDTFTSDDVPGYRRTALGYINSNLCRKKLAEVLHSQQPDVVHLHNFYHELSPGILKTLADYKHSHDMLVVMTAHDYHLVCPNSGLSFYKNGKLQIADVSRLKNISYLFSRSWDNRSIAHSLLKLAQHIYNYRLLKRHSVIDCIICPSKFMRSALSSLDIHTTHIPLPVPNICNRSIRTNSPLTFVFAGRVEPEKGLAQFLASVPDDMQGKFIVIGEGSELQLCRDISEQRQLQMEVDFIGKRPRDETLEIINRSHILVLPSVWVENSPVSLLEALAVGTNVLVSDLGGMKEIVENAGVGFTFSPGGAQSIVQTLDCVIECFNQGTLNKFDVSEFLSKRTEQEYLDRLISVYKGHSPISDEANESVEVAVV